jgi:hypothetical protein
MEIHFEGAYTMKQVWTGYVVQARAMGRSNPVTAIVIFSIVGVLLLAVGAVNLAQGREDWTPGAAGLLMTAVAVTLAYTLRRQTANSGLVGTRATGKLDETGIETTTATSHATVKWEGLHAWFADRHCLLLFTSQLVFIPVPADFFTTTGGFAAAVELARSHCKSLPGRGPMSWAKRFFLLIILIALATVIWTWLTGRSHG